MEQELLIRAKQIRALYQRELTAIHRHPHVTDAARRQQIQALWEQTVGELERIRASLGPDRIEADGREILAPPPRPAELDDA